MSDEFDDLDQDAPGEILIDPGVDPGTDVAGILLAEQVAGQVESFLEALRAVAVARDAGRGISLLLLEISQVLLAGARLGAHRDFVPRGDFQPDVGPEADLDELRLALAGVLGDVDTYSFVFDPYAPEVVEGQLSDDLSSIATDLENGLRHHRDGNVVEALWWWQFSYVASWGNLAGAALNALLSIVTHDRLDVDLGVDVEQIEAAEAALDADTDAS